MIPFPSDVVMGDAAKWTQQHLSPPSLTMRSPVARALLAGLCVTLLLVAIVRPDPAEFRARILSVSGVPSPRPAFPASPHHQLQDELAADIESQSLSVSSPAWSESHEPLSSHRMRCDVDMERLSSVRERYGLDARLQYMKRYVRFRRVDGLPRKSMTHVDGSLIAPGSLKTIKVGHSYAAERCPDPLEAEVPKSGFPSTVNASHIMFGVSTTHSRLFADQNPDHNSKSTPLDDWALWLTDGRGRSNGGKLLLMLLDAEDHQLQEAANLLSDAGIDADVYHSDSSVEMAVRYLDLVPTLYAHPQARSKHWLVTCDDDTFFPSMHGLIDTLAEFDHTAEKYIGALSEDVRAVEHHGSQAFGGAGVFLSLPMAARVTELYASCASADKVRAADSGWGPQGDILLRKCIYENTDTRLTDLWDLWQLDLFGDASGFYESGTKPLSLHHYRGEPWHSARPGQMAKIAHTCGEDCIMMRFATADDFVISGYSVAHYPQGITFDADQVEDTFLPAPEDRAWVRDYRLGPQRPSLFRTGRKIAWELQESDVRPDGSVLQTYTRKKDDKRWTYSDGQPMSNIDGVIDLVWLPS